MTNYNRANTAQINYESARDELREEHADFVAAGASSGAGLNNIGASPGAGFISHSEFEDLENGWIALIETISAKLTEAYAENMVQSGRLLNLKEEVQERDLFIADLKEGKKGVATLGSSSLSSSYDQDWTKIESTSPKVKSEHVTAAFAAADAAVETKG